MLHVGADDHIGPIPSPSGEGGTPLGVTDEG